MSRHFASLMAMIDDDIFDKMMESYTNGKIDGLPFVIFLSSEEHIKKYLEKFENDITIEKFMEDSYLLTAHITTERLENMFKFIFPDKNSQEKLMNFILKRKSISRDYMDFISEKIKENKLDINNITEGYQLYDFLTIYKELIEKNVIVMDKVVEITQDIIDRSKVDEILSSSSEQHFIDFMRLAPMELKEKIFIQLKEKGDFTTRINTYNFFNELFINQQMNINLLIDDSGSKMFFKFLYGNTEEINKAMNKEGIFEIYTQDGENIITQNERWANKIIQYLNSDTINLKDKNNKNWFECFIYSNMNEKIESISESMKLFISKGGDLAQINSQGISNLGLLAIRNPLLTYKMLKSGDIEIVHIDVISDMLKSQEVKEELSFSMKILRDYVIEKEKEILNNSVNVLVEMKEKKVSRI